MPVRIPYQNVPPEIFSAMMQVEDTVNAGGLELGLLELVRQRASLINGCAYCIDMHYKDGQRAGQSPQRLYSLSAWRETDYYDARERAALAWTDALTRVAETRAPDDVYEAVSEHFSEAELAHLTLAVIAINAWNRLVLGFRFEPGSYSPQEV